MRKPLSCSTVGNMTAIGSGGIEKLLRSLSVRKRENYFAGGVDIPRVLAYTISGS